MQIKDIIKIATKKLSNSCQRPQYEAQLLLCFYLKKDRIYLELNSDKELDNLDGFWELISRREDNEPYEYIVGEVSFYDITLYINSGVLIPRPETEILIDKISQTIVKESINSIVEIGVGSGAISIVLARKFPHLKIYATDLYDAPLRLAQKNIDKFNLSSQITLIKSNLIDNLKDSVDMVVSNPPYIANDFKLEKNVVDYEPSSALFGGRVGDELLKQIILDTKSRGIKFLACEMGYDQREPLSKFMDSLGIIDYKFYQDLAGLDRGFEVSL
ncbi:Protein-N(5)-glutamine methyltransferase PrmC, methylates polypeptide chain release factors RF1 and RF2 [hydrothermal vent metagenome]|uniref:peptide chain release factor N(5)-glutamine methyltransferase n=1 Tax=hydrothermal vent metagenome TaxID=652676 RepID=A0A1W1EHN1_9ZZZZ